MTQTEQDGQIHKKKLNKAETSIVLSGLGIKDTTEIGLNSVVSHVAKVTKLDQHLVVKEVQDVDSSVRANLDFLQKKLSVKVKEHLKELDFSIKQQQVLYKDLGSLQWEGLPFYVKRMHSDIDEKSDNGSNTSKYVPIAPSMDKSMGYFFFMLRLITESSKETPGISPYSIQPTHIVVFDKNSDESYTRHDVMRSFNYANAIGQEVQSHDGNVPNLLAWQLLVKDMQTLIKIIKDVFATYLNQCNVLKKVDDSYKDVMTHAICASKYDSEDQDYFIEYVTCRELFSIASLNVFCPDTQYETPRFMDEF